MHYDATEPIEHSGGDASRGRELLLPSNRGPFPLLVQARDREHSGAPSDAAGFDHSTCNGTDAAAEGGASNMN